MIRDPLIPQNEDSPAQLFFKFIEFFGNKFKSWEIMSPRLGGFIPKDINIDKFAYSIEDPFEKTHNPGHTVAYASTTHKIITSKLRATQSKINQGMIIFY